MVIGEKISDDILYLWRFLFNTVTYFEIPPTFLMQKNTLSKSTLIILKNNLFYFFWYL